MEQRERGLVRNMAGASFSAQYTAAQIINGIAAGYAPGLGQQWSECCAASLKVPGSILGHGFASSTLC